MDVQPTQTQQVVSIVTLTVTAIASIGALYFSWKNYLHAQKTLEEGRLAERRKTLISRLNDFYGPLLTYISVIRGLYKVFVIGKPYNFRTLTFLLDQEQTYEKGEERVKVVLTESDKKLLEEILELEKKAEEHIVKYCGLVEDPVLAFHYTPNAARTDVDQGSFEGLGLLSILITHFRVLRMAYEKKITGEVDRYKDFVYPREVDDILRKRIKVLQGELAALGGQHVSTSNGGNLG